MQSALVKVLFGVTFLVQSVVSADEVVGQFAKYTIDKDPKRTSSMIKNGSLKATVTQDRGDTHEVTMDYKFTVTLLGVKEGSDIMELEKEYFTPEFVEKLRVTKHYESPTFKADHQGFGDAKTLSGQFYPNCDKILLYDIKEPAKALFSLGISSVLYSIRGEMLEDMTALVHYYPGIPVLGGVKVDIAGLYSGKKVKAGGDFVPQP